jgi:hypothetical protein
VRRLRSLSVVPTGYFEPLDRGFRSYAQRPVRPMIDNTKLEMVPPPPTSPEAGDYGSANVDQGATRDR